MGSHHQNKFDLNGSDESANKKLITDAEIRFEFSHHRQDIARINNGSFGTCPASVIAAQKKWQRQYLQHPDNFYLHHPVVSHEYRNGLVIESAWIGTRDYSPQLVVPDVIEFVNRFEGRIEGIRKRKHSKVFEMAEILTNAWGTNLGAPPEMCASMAMVGLPACLEIESDSDCFKLRAHLRTHFGVEVPIYYQVPPLTKDDNEKSKSVITGYARISYQVYNIVEDYYKFRDAISKFVKDGITCEQLS